MPRYLTAGVIVDRPGVGASFLEEGSELPDWAASLVGDHALTEDDVEDTEGAKDEPAPARRRRSSSDKSA